MATAGREIPSVEKLNNSNYSNWAFKLEMLLIKDDLFKLVTAYPLSMPDGACGKKAKGNINL